MESSRKDVTGVEKVEARRGHGMGQAPWMLVTQHNGSGGLGAGKTLSCDWRL